MRTNATKLVHHRESTQNSPVAYFNMPGQLSTVGKYGVVTNLTRFGAFVDIGVKQDGLVHVSEISHEYITDPAEKLKLNQKVMVKVLEVDMARKRISLSIKQAEEGGTTGGKARPRKDVKRQEKPQEDLSNLNLNDALSALKKKFGK